MAQHNRLGKRGEEEACLYLTMKGYRLLERNYRTGHWETDIIADYFGEIVFVEVKTRHDEDYIPALTAIDTKKQDNLIKAAKTYMIERHIDAPYRFDAILLIGTQPPFQIRHILNAFTPEGVETKKRHGHI